MKKQIIKTLSLLFPQMMANQAYKILNNPQVKKLREHELEMLDQAQKSTLRFKNFDIQTYQWGNPDHEKILLIHGWEGQAGNFTDLIKKLLSNNYQVTAFDAPSHGFSSKGSTSVFEFSELVGVMMKKYPTQKLVSHSFGGVATTNALFENQDVEIDKYALLTTPNKFSERIDDVAKFVGVTEKVKQLLINRIEKELNIDIGAVAVSEIVSEINVKKALIIHDKNDRVIPIKQSKTVYENWDNCQFKTVEGTGHFRILRTESVLDDVLAFMAD